MAAVGLRAVARELGLTPPALYRYFPSHEALIGALIADLYDELTAALMDLAGHRRPTRISAPGCTCSPTASGTGRLAHPAEFALLFGTAIPSPDADDHEQTPGHQAAMRFGSVFKELVAQIWHWKPFPLSARRGARPESGRPADAGSRSTSAGCRPARSTCR